jgi:hypothetical protein
MSRKYKSGLLEECFIEGRAQADACARMGGLKEVITNPKDVKVNRVSGVNPEF